MPGELEALLIRWAVLALIGVALATTGFVKGCEYQQGRDAIAEKEVLVRKEEIRHEVTVGQEKITAAFRAGKASRDSEFLTLDEELRKTKGERDAKAAVCDLSDHDLRVLNSSRVPRRPAADIPGPAGGMPSADGIARWAAEHAGGNAATGLQGPMDVPRPPQSAR